MLSTDRIEIFGRHESPVVAQLERCVAQEEGARGVLCADGHLGYSQPIGGAVAYREHVSIAGVGFDIACGCKAVRTPLTLADLGDEVPRIMDDIVRRISFGMGRANERPVDHPVVDEIAQAEFEPQRDLHDVAAKQLGTVGGGNHYVDLFADDQEQIWIGVHFGSRGFGHKTASGFLALAQGRAFGEHAPEGAMDSPPVLLEVDSELGQAYISAMELAGRYAYAGRDVVVDEVLDILGTTAEFEVHNHHNYSWKERHHGEDVWVVRKGCTPAFPGQLGFVGASMGEPAVILEGLESERSAAGLYSTVHGAGRAMSRRQAAGKIGTVAECTERDCAYCVPIQEFKRSGKRTLCPIHPNGRMRKVRRVVKPGAIDFAEVRRDLARKGIELRGGAADEAPGAYKRLRDVLAEHDGTVRILHELYPIGVAMAGADVFDPYKD